MKIYKIASGDLYQNLVTALKKNIGYGIYSTNKKRREAFFKARRTKRNLSDEEYMALWDRHFPVNDEMIDSFAQDVVSEINKMGIDYSIESFYAPGMAKTDKLILSEMLFRSARGTGYLLFTIFHELAHFYQYRKYGHDFALSIYTNDISQIEQDVDKLLEIENTANKFGLMKASYYLRKYGIDASDLEGIASGTYSDRSKVIDHVKKIKDAVEGMEPDQRSIEQINEYIYGLFK
jgi:hypothetical protein